MASVAKRIWRFYYEGFRDMSSVGRALWVLIIVKLLLIFVFMKLLFFPNILQRDFDTDAQRAEHVRQELTGR